MGDGSPPRILVVDDHDDNRIWLRKLLEHVGFEVREAANGLDALAVFDAWTPVVLLVDLHMPVMDGFATMRALRARPRGRTVVIVAVTVSAFDDTRDAIFEAGADGWLRKPCRETQLLDEIARLTGVQYRYLTPPARSLPPMPAVRPASAGGLPPDLVELLRGAAHVADYDRLCEIIATIPEGYAHIAHELRQLIERYAYDEIERRVDPDAVRTFSTP